MEKFFLAKEIYHPDGRRRDMRKEMAIRMVFFLQVKAMFHVIVVQISLVENKRVHLRTPGVNLHHENNAEGFFQLNGSMDLLKSQGLSTKRMKGQYISTLIILK